MFVVLSTRGTDTFGRISLIVFWVFCVLVAAFADTVSRGYTIIFNLKYMWLRFVQSPVANEPKQISLTRVGTGCTSALLRGFIEPLIVIAALINHTGNRALALIALGGIIFSWCSPRLLPKSTIETSKTVTFVSSMRPTVVRVVQENPRAYNLWSLFLRVVMLVPTVYLWYLFFELTDS